jgi:predicted metal-dependent enzyme (double-stranded beta helix superfamily)
LFADPAIVWLWVVARFRPARPAVAVRSPYPWNPVLAPPKTPAPVIEIDGGSAVFDKERFIEDCIDANAEGQSAIRDVLANAVRDRAGITRALGEPEHAGITPLYRSDDLTIIHFVWAPCMSLMPHNHQMFSVVGIYAGREDNVFWRRTETSIEAAGARSLGVGDVATLGRDVIHSVLNPIGKMTCALHVYGGNFFEPAAPRSQWDPESLGEQPWDIEGVKSLFRDAETRFHAVASGSAGR